MSIDFLNVAKEIDEKKRTIVVFPIFLVGESKDLMIRGGDFYAIWIEKKQLWSTREQDVIDLVDRELMEEAQKSNNTGYSVKVKLMRNSNSGSIDAWHKYCQKQCRDNFTPLDEQLIFSDTQTTREHFASKKLPYPLKEGSISAWDALLSVLYSPDERHKIEWAIGAIISGDSKYIQKFMVFYGSAGTGKSTVMNIMEKLFAGYTATFDARALGSANSSFALEPFKNNPLVAIQQDGDLSRIEDNTRLNSLVSHEKMTVNQKFKSMYDTNFSTFLFMGTNKPVKITDAKSGLIRRLIDVTPTGNLLPKKEYDKQFALIDFELGAIAYHCLQVYMEDPDYYDEYIPTSMMASTNDFYNYIAEVYYTFEKQDGTTLKQAWELYKDYCEDAKVSFPYPRRIFQEELKNYFAEFNARTDTGNGYVRNVYSGFLTDKFEEFHRSSSEVKEDKLDNWIVFQEGIPSILDEYLKDCPAQYAEGIRPEHKWENVTTKLKDINTHKLHYVQTQSIPQLIQIDFDIPDENGNKDLSRNLEAAGKWPPTYAETSKSGEGIHLSYLYSGDVSKLQQIFDDHIEIKVFTGNSSLRRLVTKCNDLPIATLSSGLPVKEDKKLFNETQFQSEKGLRTTIAKCLRKEVHPGTKPNVDFIYDILEKAYNSGMPYDVSDLRKDILAFAVNSTNQAETCVKLVSQMHFRSEEEAPPLTDVTDNTQLVFYDIEVFPNLFLVNWKFAGENEPVHRMINPTSQEIESLVKFRLVGFNNRNYDDHILYARMLGYSNYELYKLSQRIINGTPEEKRNAKFREAYRLSYTDIYDFASAGNKMSLKKWEIKLGITHLELGLPWDEPVAEELWTKVAEYCDNDVISTEAVFNSKDMQADWTARQILADLADMTVGDTTNQLTTKIIFGNNRNPQSEFCYRDMSKPVHADELDGDVLDFLYEACPEMMAQKHGENGDSILPYFPGYQYDQFKNKSTYRGEEFGEGGYVYSEPGMYGDVALLDIASMHPHSLIAEVLFGPRFTKAFRDIVEGRVSIKHKAWDEVNHILDGKLTPYIQKVIDGEMTAKQLANALKTAINSVYGLTSAKFMNAFKDKRNIDNIVAKRGELFMIDLKNEVQHRGFTVVHIKTDSIKIADATPEIIDFVMNFGKRYGYTFEHEATYDRMCLVNKAVYIARYATREKCEKMYGYCPGDNYDHGWQWTATGDQFAVPYIYKSLFTKESLDFSDFCETFQVSKGNIYLDMNENLDDVAALEKELAGYEDKFKKGKISDTTLDEERKRLEPEIAKGHNLTFVGRVGQFTPVIEGAGGGIMYRVDNGKNYATAGSKGYRWLESANIINRDDRDDIIDKSFYRTLADQAISDIQMYSNGMYDWFVSEDPYVPPEFTDLGTGWMHPVYPEELPFY